MSEQTDELVELSNYVSRGETPAPYRVWHHLLQLTSRLDALEAKAEPTRPAPTENEVDPLDWLPEPQPTQEQLEELQGRYDAKCTELEAVLRGKAIIVESGGSIRVPDGCTIEYLIVNKGGNVFGTAPSPPRRMVTREQVNQISVDATSKWILQEYGPTLEFHIVAALEQFAQLCGVEITEP